MNFSYFFWRKGSRVREIWKLSFFLSQQVKFCLNFFDRYKENYFIMNLIYELSNFHILRLKFLQTKNEFFLRAFADRLGQSYAFTSIQSFKVKY